MPPSRSGAGGKIVTSRRKQRLSATPYERPLPPPPAPPPEKSPNWFTGIVVPSARAIASGAGRIFSSIFSESESSCSEEEDSASENDVDNDNHTGNSHDGLSKLDEYGKESQLPTWRAETKKLITQLIMQETFTREECDKLTEVLNSRVMGGSIEEGKKNSLTGFPGKMAAHEDGDIYNKAVEEAKKWIQEKKVVVSSSARVFSCGTSNLNLTGFAQVERGGDSPVDVARSYMNDRPPWASPTRNFESRTPLSATMKLFGEGSSSVGRDSLSSSKKWNSLASGSWNIQEELRRVRLKATEDMLHIPSTKIDPSLFAVGKNKEDSVGAGKVVLAIEKRIMEPDSSRNSKPVNELFDAGVSYDHPALAVLETRQDGKFSEALLSRPAPSNHGNNEGQEAVREDGEPTASKRLLSLSTNHADEHHTEPQLNKANGTPTTVVTVHVEQSTNGLSSSQASLPAGPNTDSALYTGQNYDQHDLELNDADAANENTSVNNNHAEGAYMDVPIATETNSIANGSPSSMGVQNEELPSESQPSPKEKVAGKQQVRKSTQGNRRSLRKR